MSALLDEGLISKSNMQHFLDSTDFLYRAGLQQLGGGGTGLMQDDAWEKAHFGAVVKENVWLPFKKKKMSVKMKWSLKMWRELFQLLSLLAEPESRQDNTSSIAVI